VLQRSVWQPLVDLRVIRRHHALVALFVGDPELHDELRVALKAVPDLDRLGARPTRAQAKLPGPADPRTPAAVTLPGLLAKLEGAVAAGEGESDGGGGGEGGGAAALLRNAPGDVLRGAGPPAPPGTVGAVVDMAHYSDGAVGTLDVLPGSAHAAAFAPAPYCRPGVVAPGDEGGGASLCGCCSPPRATRAWSCRTRGPPSPTTTRCSAAPCTSRSSWGRTWAASPRTPARPARPAPWRRWAHPCPPAPPRSPCSTQCSSAWAPATARSAASQRP